MSDYPFLTRPISTWPKGEYTPARERRRSPFASGWTTTIEQLHRELRHLGAKNIVLEVALEEAQIRLDGRPRAGAIAEHPGVVLSFESAYGPLRYATDSFTHWQANLRAIALGLEALRKVERYGITKRGEQYVGWKAIEAASQSADDARQFLAETVGERASFPNRDAELDDRDLVRIARRVAHPDAPMGGHDLFLAVQHAAETLDVA